MARLPITDSQGNYNTNQGGNPVPDGYVTRNPDGRFSPSTPTTPHQNTGVIIDNGDGTYTKKDFSTGEYVNVNASGEKVDRRGVKIDNVRNYKTDYIFAHYIRNYNNPYFDVAGVTILYTQKELEGLTIDEKVQFTFDTLLAIKQQLQYSADFLGETGTKLSDILNGVGGISTAVGGLVTGVSLAATLTGIGAIVTGLATFFGGIEIGGNSEEDKKRVKQEALLLTEYYGKVAEYYVMYLDAQKKGQLDVNPNDLAKNGIKDNKSLFSSLFTSSNSNWLIFILLALIGLYVYKKRKGGRKK